MLFLVLDNYFLKKLIIFFLKGLVKAPFFTTAVQVFSRLLITFILFHIKEVKKH